MPEFSRRSLLAVDRAQLWDHCVSPQGINSEFRPLLRMTFPSGLRHLHDNWQPGERLFRSWILLFGIIPIEFDDITLVEVEREFRFLERSTMLSQRVWEHERRLETTDEGIWLEDRIRFEPRAPILGPLYALVFQLVFRFRHRQLQNLFARPAAQQSAAADTS